MQPPPQWLAIRLAGLLSMAIAAPHAAAAAENRTRAGEFVVDHPPTLINPGFEWVIEGDDNRPATHQDRNSAVVEARHKPPHYGLRE